MLIACPWLVTNSLDYFARQRRQRGRIVTGLPNRFWTRQDADTPARKIELGLVMVSEVSAITQDGIDVFQVQDRAVWYSLTSLPVDTEESIARVVYFYSLRWRIERFH